MPNFLKTLFKPQSSRRSQSGNLPPGVEFSPPGQHANLPTDELTALTQLLRDKLGNGAGSSRRSVLQAIRDHPNGGDETMRQLTAVLDRATSDQVTPFQSDESAGHTRRRRLRSDQWTEAIEACTAALASAERLSKSSMAKKERTGLPLDRICSLLEAQKEELLDIRQHAERHGLPTLHTLSEMYAKIHAGLRDATSMSSADAAQTLTTLVQVLREGPDYLIDVSIIEAIVWQGEVIDPGFGAEMRQILDTTVAGRPDDPATFPLAVENIIALSSALPRDLLDEIEAIDAYKAVGALIKHLQTRLGSSRPGSPTSFFPSQEPSSGSHRAVAQPSSTRAYPASTPLESPAISTPPSAKTSRSTSPDPDFNNFKNASDLQAMYGTGPISTQSKTVSLAPTPATPRPPPSPSEADTEESEIWEYRGNMLTRSALSLVLRQEALAKADSSGQYAGEVSWDDLRNAYVPRWAEKLKPEDVADGEIPSTNPAEYKVKKKDAWGNRIGWRDGVMYYEEEPTFELPDDD